MSLTLEIEHRLKDKGFDKLYEAHTAKWVEMAGKAEEYTKSLIGGGQAVRPGDISENLQNGIKIDPDFEAHLKGRRLTQKYWVRYFADYILERIFPSNIKEEKKK